MMDRKKRIYYPAGIISLALLPLLCLWHFNAEKAFEQRGLVDVALFAKADTMPSRWSLSLSIPFYRKYLSIAFSGNDKNDSLKLTFAKMAINELVEAKDTLNGVHISLNDKTKYWAFVKTVELGYAKEIHSYMDQNNA